MVFDIDWGINSINSTLALGRDSQGNATYFPYLTGNSTTDSEDEDESPSGAAVVGGAAILSNILAGISKYQASKKNYSILQQNYFTAQQALETNIAAVRQQNEMRAAENRAQIGASGIKSDSFADVMQSNKIIEENDIAIMRANLREQMYQDLRQAVKDKYKSQRQAFFGGIGAVAGGYAGMMTGSPKAAIALSGAGSSLGQALGG